MLKKPCIVYTYDAITSMLSHEIMHINFSECDLVLVDDIPFAKVLSTKILCCTVYSICKERDYFAF